MAWWNAYPSSWRDAKWKSVTPKVLGNTTRALNGDGEVWSDIECWFKFADTSAAFFLVHVIIWKEKPIMLMNWNMRRNIELLDCALNLLEKWWLWQLASQTHLRRINTNFNFNILVYDSVQAFKKWNSKQKFCYEIGSWPSQLRFQGLYGWYSNGCCGYGYRATVAMETVTRFFSLQCVF